MAVLLGQSGQVELRRLSLEESIRAEVAVSDVNYVKNRFSFDFHPGALLTGDQVEIKTQDGSLLSFVAPSGWPANKQYPDGLFYLHVDEAGGIKLYESFSEAISGESAGRIDLVDAGRTVPIEVTVRNNSERILGQVIDFELNTEREAPDVTALTDEFRKNVSGLISGSGRLQCFFDYEAKDCDPSYYGVDQDDLEMPIYMNQLLIRTRTGSEFWGKLTLVRRGAKPYGGTEDANDEIWYEFDGRITNVAMAFSATEPVRATIDFVTTGEIRLRTRFTSNYLLAEQGAGTRLRLEKAQTGFLELEDRE